MTTVFNIVWYVCCNHRITSWWNKMLWSLVPLKLFVEILISLAEDVLAVSAQFLATLLGTYFNKIFPNLLAVLEFWKRGGGRHHKIAARRESSNIFCYCKSGEYLLFKKYLILYLGEKSIKSEIQIVCYLSTIFIFIMHTFQLSVAEASYLK